MTYINLFCIKIDRSNNHAPSLIIHQLCDFLIQYINNCTTLALTNIDLEVRETDRFSAKCEAILYMYTHSAPGQRLQSLDFMNIKFNGYLVKRVVFVKIICDQMINIDISLSCMNITVKQYSKELGDSTMQDKMPRPKFC